MSPSRARSAKAAPSLSSCPSSAVSARELRDGRRQQLGERHEQPGEDQAAAVPLGRSWKKRLSPLCNIRSDDDSTTARA